MRSRRPIAAAALAAAVLAAAPMSGASATAAADAQPTRLWYRVFATISASRAADVDRGPERNVSDHLATTLELRLRSRTAVLLYRLCTPLNDPSGRLNGKELQTLLNLTRSSFTCKELRAALRDRGGYPPGFVRRLRLADDVRFDANGQGFVDKFNRQTERPAHTETRRNGAIIDCPAQTLEINRTTGPERIGGRLSTQSLVRDGIMAAVRFTLRLAHDVEVGSEGGPCTLRATGTPVNTTRVVRGFSAGSVFFGPHAQYGPVPRPAPIRTTLAGRFGTSFRIIQRQDSVEQLVGATWTTHVFVELTFTPCPRGGRDAGGC